MRKESAEGKNKILNLAFLPFCLLPFAFCLATMEIPGLALARHKMVRDQLQRRGIHDRRALEAMEKVPREEFTLPELAEQAYADRALPIACDQTISQPYIVGLMTQALDLRGPERVLEIGTGSGYQTAILSRLAAHVVSLERHAPLIEKARAALTRQRCDNVQLIMGDGWAGWPERAPYDRILVAAAAATCPQALIDQLADGGRLVIPLGDSQSQVLQTLSRHGDQQIWEDLVACRFVPLVASEAR